MKFIDTSKLEAFAKSINWETTQKGHIAAVKSKAVVKDRKKYVNDNPDWNQFQSEMLKLSNNKCWYTESAIGSSDFEVDHFRPKNKAKNHDKKVIKPNGYWWIAYDWENFRLTGALANKRRRDRLKEGAEVKG